MDNRHGGVEKYGWDFPWSRKLCSGDYEMIQNTRIRGDNQFYGIKLEASM